MRILIFFSIKSALGQTLPILVQFYNERNRLNEGDKVPGVIEELGIAINLNIAACQLKLKFE